MKKKVFALALLTATATSFAAPISAPNNVNDTPIISNGGGTVGGGQCQAYQTDGTTVNLSGGETLIFYGGGNPLLRTTFGGYLSTKSTYSGTTYLKTKYYGSYGWSWGTNDYYYGEYYSGKAIGLFARNSDQQSDFIAGAGASGGITVYGIAEGDFPGSGGGWQTGNANIYSGGGFFDNTPPLDLWWEFRDKQLGGIGFFNGQYYPPTRNFFDIYSLFGGAGSGGASSISAFYDYYTKQYTLAGSSYTITGNGIPGSEPILYVCK